MYVARRTAPGPEGVLLERVKDGDKRYEELVAFMKAHPDLVAVVIDTSILDRLKFFTQEKW